MRYTISLYLSYLGVSFVVGTVWLLTAKTELQGNGWCSVVNLAENRTALPFVKRRLLVDSARLTAALVPQQVWVRLTNRIQQGTGPRFVQAQRILHKLHWTSDHYPILFCSTLLIWGSILGFMLTCRWLVNLLYEAPFWMADLVGAVLGVALLGAYGDWHYQAYPYDCPQAFVFALCLAAIVARKWWFPLAFLAAAYSKETSVLLIPAFVLLAPSRRSSGFWGILTLVTVTYAAVYCWIDVCHTPPRDAPFMVPEGTFWFPERNFRLMWRSIVFYSWWLVPLLIALHRFNSFRRLYPAGLKKLLLLGVPLCGAAFFKGWMEEMRQYMELLPVTGLLAAQWVTQELGRGHLLVARSENDNILAREAILPMKPSRRVVTVDGIPPDRVAKSA